MILVFPSEIFDIDLERRRVFEEVFRLTRVISCGLDTVSPSRAGLGNAPLRQARLLVRRVSRHTSWLMLFQKTPMNQARSQTNATRDSPSREWSEVVLSWRSGLASWQTRLRDVTSPPEYGKHRDAKDFATVPGHKEWPLVDESSPTSPRTC